MAADNILGISAQFDYTDIVNGIKVIGNEFSKLKGVSEETSNGVTKALQELGNATEKDLAQKAKTATDVLTKAFEEAKNGAEQNVTKIENSIARLQERLQRLSVARSETVTGTNTYERLTRQIESTNTQIHNQQELLSATRAELDNFKAGVALINEEYQKLSQNAEQVNVQLPKQSEQGKSVFPMPSVEEIEAQKQKADEFTGKLSELAKSAGETYDKIVELYNSGEQVDATSAFNLLTEFKEKTEQVREAAERAYWAQMEYVRELSQRGISLSLDLHQAETKGNSEEAARLREELAHVNEELKTAEHNQVVLQEAWASSKKEVQDTELTLTKIVESQNGAVEKEKQLTEETKKTADKAKELKDNMDKVPSSADKAKKSIEGAKKEIQGAMTSMNAVKGGNLMGMLGTAGAAMTNPYVIGLGAIAGGVAYLTKKAQELDEAMMPLRAYVNEGTLSELRNGFIDVAMNSEHSSTEMAAAAVHWVKAYESIRDSSDAIVAVTKASNEWATIARISSEQAAKQLTTIAGEFHMNAYDATQLVNQLVNAAQKSTASYTELESALQGSGTRAAQAGVSFRELAAATSYASANYNSASTAASQYVMMMTRLSAQQKDEYNPSVVGSTTALQNLHAAMERGEDISSLFGKRLFTQARYFIDNAEAIAQFSDGLDNSTAKTNALMSAEERAEVNQKKLTNAIDAMVQEINLNVTPAVTNMVNGITDFISAAGNAGAAVTNFIADLQNAYPTMMSFAQNLMQLMGYLSNPIGAIAKGIGIVGKDTPVSGWELLTGKSGGQKRREATEQIEALLDQQINAQRATQGKLFDANFNAIAKSRAKTLSSWYQKDSKTGNYKVNLGKGNVVWLTPQEFDQIVNSKLNSVITQHSANVRGKILDPGAGNHITGNTRGRGGGGGDTAAQAAKERERIAEEERRWSEKMQKEQREAGFAERQAHIDGLEEGFEKEREQQELEYDKQKAQIKEQEEQYRKEAYEHAKKEWDADSKNKHKAFSDNHNIADFAPTEEQQRIIDASLRSAAEKHRKAVEEVNRDELNTYYEFLNEYGTLQQQRYAVTAEYDERIAKEKDVNRRKMLEKEKASKLSSLNAQSLAMNIDWGQTFSGLGNVLSSVAEATLKKVNDYMKTDEYRKSGAQDKQVYQELRAQLMSASGNNMSNPFAASTWKNIGNLAKQYEASVEFLIKAQEKEKKAREDLEKAVDDEAKARAKAAFEEASEAVKQAEGAVAQNQQALQDATQKAANGLTLFNETLSNITSGSLKGFADGVIKLIGAIAGDDGLAKGLEGMGKAGTIVGAILSILDALGTKPVEFIEELFDKLAETLQEVIKNLPQIILSAVKGVGSMIGGIFSGIGSWFGLTSSGNVAEVNEITEKNTKTIERLNKSIDKLKDAIDKSNGARAVTSYEEAYSAQQRIIQQQLEILRAQMAYTSSHHSNAKNWGKEFDRSNYAQINALLGTNINSLEGIYGLSPEQMDKIRTHLTDVWKDMLDVGKYDKSEYWENYADLAGKLDELTEQINENLTQTSFDSMRDNFVSALMDMNTSASDFTKNFSEMMMQSLLNMSIGNILDDELKGWYDKWAERLKAGELSPYEIAQYRKEWDSMVARGMEERDRLAQLTGYDVMYQDQSATSRGIQNITQDQAEQLIGRITAIQIAVEQGNVQRTELVGMQQSMLLDTSTLRQSAQSIAMDITEMRDMQYTSLQRLEQIAINTAPIGAMADNVDKIRRRVEDNL